MEYLSGVSEDGKFLTSIVVGRRNPPKRTLVAKNVAFLYGHRPVHEDVWYLSPYEFVCYWQVRLARYPGSVDENDNDAYHAKLTPKGAAKLKQRDAELTPGIDYQVKERGGTNWLPLPDGDEAVNEYRHTWVFER
jgi:hypothetical protein